MQVDGEPCILCGTIYMQVGKEAMYSMRNNLHASGRRSHVFYAEQSTCKCMKKEEAMYSMQNNLHASE